MCSPGRPSRPVSARIQFSFSNQSARRIRYSLRASPLIIGWENQALGGLCRANVCQCTGQHSEPQLKKAKPTGDWG